MIEVCDPDANISDLKRLIKLNTGHEIKLTKSEICQVYDDIKAGKLPLPPLIMSSDKTYLVDKKSPLKPNDYETLFSSSSKRSDIKRVARKVGLKQVEQMTKSQMIDSIGKRLRYMRVYEPVKIGSKRTVKVETRNNSNGLVNNTAVNNLVNNTAVNNSNNTAVNNSNNTAVNNSNGFNNTTINNTAMNIFRTSKNEGQVSFPKGGLFMKGKKPKFLNGNISAVKVFKNKENYILDTNTNKN